VGRFRVRPAPTGERGKPLDLLGWYRGYVDVKRDGEPQPVALPVQADDGGDRRAGLPAFASDAARVSAP
jgi:hypothetical protein